MSQLFVTRNNLAAVAHWCHDRVALFGNYTRLLTQAPDEVDVIDPIDLGNWLDDIFDQMSDNKFVLLEGTFVSLQDSSFTGCVVEFQGDTLLLPHYGRLCVKIPAHLEFSACDNMLMIGISDYCWILPFLADGLLDELRILLSRSERYKSVRQIQRAYRNYPELAENCCFFQVGPVFHTAIIANDEHAFGKWGHVICSVHGVSPFQQCPMCHDNDGEFDMFGLALADLDPNMYIGSSHFVGLSLEDFGQYNRNVWKTMHPQNIVNSNSGCLINPSDKYCVFKSILQFCTYTQDELIDYTVTTKMLCNNIKGSFPSNSLPALLINTPVQVFQLQDVLQNDQLCCPAKNFSLISGQGHCLSYIPKHKSMRDYLPISMFLTNMYALTVMMDHVAKPEILNVVSKHPDAIPRSHQDNKCSKRGVKKPPLSRKSASEYLQQPTSLGSVKVGDVGCRSSKYAYVCTHCSKAKNVYFKSPRQQVAAKISHYIRSQKIFYDDLPQYDRHACLLWHDFVFAIQYDKIYSKNLPVVACQRSFQMATGLAKDLFKEYYKIDDRAVVKRFTEPISLGSRSSYKIDLVQQSALNSLSGDKILSIHMPKTSMIPNPIIAVKKLKASFRRIYAQLNGIVDRELLEVLVKYGLQIDSLSLKQNSKCGGHAFLRYVIDLLQANSLTRILNVSCFINMIIDIGAKYGSNAALLQAATKIPGITLLSKTDSYSYRLSYLLKIRQTYFQPKMIKISKTYLDFLETNSLCISIDLPVDVPPFFKTILQSYRDTQLFSLLEKSRQRHQQIVDDENSTADEIRASQEFLSKNACPVRPQVLDYTKMFCEYARYILQLPRMFYLPIRPNDNDYDRLYHLESKDYQHYEHIQTPGQITLLPLIKTTLQSAEKQIEFYQRQFQQEKSFDVTLASDSQLMSIIESGQIQGLLPSLEPYQRSMNPEKKKSFLKRCNALSIIDKNKIMNAVIKKNFLQWNLAGIKQCHLMDLGKEKACDNAKDYYNIQLTEANKYYKNCYGIQNLQPLDQIIDKLNSSCIRQPLSVCDSGDGLLGDVTFNDLCDDVADFTFMSDKSFTSLDNNIVLDLAQTEVDLPTLSHPQDIIPDIPRKLSINLLDVSIVSAVPTIQPLQINSDIDDPQLTQVRLVEIKPINNISWDFSNEYKFFLEDYEDRRVDEQLCVYEPFVLHKQQIVKNGVVVQKVIPMLDVLPKQFFVHFNAYQRIPQEVWDKMQRLNLYQIPDQKSLQSKYQNYISDVQEDSQTGYAANIIHQIPDILSLYEKCRIEQDYSFWDTSNIQQLLNLPSSIILKTLLRAQHYKRQGDAGVFSDFFLSSKSVMFDFSIEYSITGEITSIDFKTPTRTDGSKQLYPAYLLLLKLWGDDMPKDILTLENIYFSSICEALLELLNSSKMNIILLLMNTFKTRGYSGEYSPLLTSLLRDPHLFLCNHNQALYFQNFDFQLTFPHYSFSDSFLKIMKQLKISLPSTSNSKMVSIDPFDVLSSKIPKMKSKRSLEQQASYELNLKIMEHPVYMASEHVKTEAMRGYICGDISIVLYCNPECRFRTLNMNTSAILSDFPLLASQICSFDKFISSLSIPTEALAGRNDVQVSLFMNDTHYYMSGYAPSFKCTMYVTGCHFHPFPGRYVLPGGEGSYQIYADEYFKGQVAMKTQGSAVPYVHPLTFVKNPGFSIDYGWFSHFQKIHVHVPGTSSIIEQPCLPKVTYLKSIQDSFFLEHLNTVSDDVQKFQTLTSLQRQSVKKAYTSQEIDEILSKGFISDSDQQSLIGRAFDFFYKKQSTILKSQIDTFVKYNNYSIMKNLKQFSQVKILGGLLSSSKTLTYSESYQTTIKTGFFQKQQNKMVIPNDLPNILLAGRTADMDILSLQQFGKLSTDINEMKNFKHLISATRPVTSVTDKNKDPQISRAQPLVSDYFKCKQPPQLAPQNLLTIPNSQAYQQLSENYAKFLSNHSDQPQSYSKKNGFRLFEGKTKISKCGYDLIQNGQVVQSFEWASKCIQNSAAAFVGRQINSQTSIDPKMLKIFDEVCTNYLGQLVYKMAQDQVFVRNLRDFNPYEWLDKKLFPEDKKQKYFATLFKQSVSPDPKFISSFKTMVKSGEVQFTNHLEHLDGFLTNQSSRPRNISIPSADTCGGLTALQSCIFPAIQRVDPGFIQATTKEMQTQRYKDVFDSVRPDKSISLDGSSFDSTQYAPLQRMVDARFWQLLEPIFDEHLYKNSPYRVQPNYIRNLVRDACQLTHTLFVYLPCQQKYSWTSDQNKVFQRDWPRDFKHDFSHEYQYMPILIHGTTFSGHPTATTLGNTLRSICYVHFYARMANIGFEHYRYFAAGDDVNIFCSPLYTDRMYSSILKHTARSNEPVPGTLGQIVKEIRLSNWDDIDFCSKWSYSNGSYSSFRISRDCYKTLATRLFYSGSNKLFMNNPDLYVDALYQGFKSEHLSKLLEDLLISRKKSDICLTQDQWKNLDISKSFEENHDGSYLFENDINARLSISVYTLLRNIRLQQVELAGRSAMEHIKIPVYSYTYDSSNLCLHIYKNFSWSHQSPMSKMRRQAARAEKYVKIDKNEALPPEADAEVLSDKQANREFNGFLRKNKIAPSGTNALYQGITHLKQTYGIPKKSVQEIQKIVKNSSDPLHAKIVALMSFLHSRSSSELVRAIGMKQVETLDSRFATMKPEEQRQLLCEILLDDWGPAIKAVSSAALPHIWRAVKNSSYGQKAIGLLRDYLGIDINDDSLVLGPHFQRAASYQRQLNWADFSSKYQSESSSYDGVSTQAICSMLFPEYVKSRIPSDQTVKCGLVAKQYSTTITTNASGHVGLCLRPWYLCTGNWVQVLNASDFSAATWAQASAGTWTNGPLQGLTTVTGFRLTACCIEIQPIVSSLNNSGMITTCMNDDTSAIVPNALPVTPVTVRDSQYLTYGNLMGSSGHRLVYHNDNVGDLSFQAYSYSPSETDYMIVVVTGAQASSAVLQLTISYQCEFTSVGNVLVEQSTTPAGPATLKCLASALSANPNLRLLGHQESVQLYSALLTSIPRYDSVLNTLLAQPLITSNRQVFTSSGNSGISSDA